MSDSNRNSFVVVADSLRGCFAREHSRKLVPSDAGEHLSLQQRRASALSAPAEDEGPLRRTRDTCPSRLGR